MKIIAFIDPSKFGALLGPDLQKTISFAVKDSEGDSSYLNGGENLVYIYDSYVECNNYSQDKFNTAKIILVPDEFQLQHSFSGDFKIIRHSRDINIENIKALSDKFFQGILQSMEETYKDGKETPYKIIVDIIKEVLNKNKISNFEEFYKSIPNFNFELEESLNVLHLCLNPENLDQINYGFISKLPVNTKNILLNEIGAIVKLKEHKSDGPFGSNFVEALEDLRDDLFSGY